jgi:hypothetical protein
MQAILICAATTHVRAVRDKNTNIVTALIDDVMRGGRR